MGDDEARRTPEIRGGRLYPMDSIIAHIGDGEQAAAAEAALRDAGWEGDDVVTASGERVTQVSGTTDASRGFLDRLTAAFPSEEANIENEFKEAAARGTWAIMVTAETDERRSAATTILRANGAYGLRHYGKRVITDM